MTRLVCARTAQGILSGVLFVAINRSASMKIVQEKDSTSTGSVIDMHVFVLESLVREYERKFETIPWLYQDTAKWDMVSKLVSTILEQDSSESTWELIVTAVTLCVQGEWRSARKMLRALERRARPTIDLRSILPSYLPAGR